MATAKIPAASRIKEIARLKLAKIPAETPLEEYLRSVCQISSDAIGVERVGVWLFIDDRKVLRCANLFERSKEEHCVGAVLRVADYPSYFASLTIRKAVPAEVVSSEPWTAELNESYLKPLGITSMLDAGIFQDGELIGAVCHENVGAPREWTTEDRDFAGSVADLVSLKLKSAELRELRSAFMRSGQRVAQNDKITALEALAGGIGHDFREILKVFHECGVRLAKGAASIAPADLASLGRAILDAAEKGAELSRDLISFAEPSDKRLKVCDMEEVIADFLPAIREILGERYAVSFQPSPGSGRVLLSRTQFFRILMNLVVNARDAMPEGGTITVRLSGVRLTGDPSYQGSFAMLEVLDRGRGIDEATRKRIFDPYFSTKSLGAGLGLAAVKQFVDRSGGIVRVESEPGKGTSFRLFFPKVGSGTTGSTAQYTLPPEFAAQAAVDR
jgi:signal transduction histidine kinase